MFVFPQVQQIESQLAQLQSQIEALSAEVKPYQELQQEAIDAIALVKNVYGKIKNTGCQTETWVQEILEAVEFAPIAVKSSEQNLPPGEFHSNSTEQTNIRTQDLAKEPNNAPHYQIDDIVKTPKDEVGTVVDITESGWISVKLISGVGVFSPEKLSLVQRPDKEEKKQIKITPYTINSVFEEKGWEEARKLILEQKTQLSYWLMDFPKSAKKMPKVVAEWAVVHNNGEVDEIFVDSPYEKEIQDLIESIKDNSDSVPPSIKKIFALAENKDATWEDFRKSANSSGSIFELLAASLPKSRGRKSKKVTFVENLPQLLLEYIKRTGDESDLSWVPFAEEVRSWLSIPSEPRMVAVELSEIDKFLNSIKNSARMEEVITWQDIERVCQRDKNKLNELVALCVVPKLIKLRDRLPSMVAKYIESLGEEAVIGWIPGYLLSEADRDTNKESNYHVLVEGDKVRITSSDCSIEPGEVVVIHQLEDGWITTHHKGLRAHLHVDDVEWFGSNLYAEANTVPSSQCG